MRGLTTDFMKDLSDEQAMEVLEKVKQEHDTSMGVSRATVDIWADELFPVAFSVFLW